MTIPSADRPIRVDVERPSVPSVAGFFPSPIEALIDKQHLASIDDITDQLRANFQYLSEAAARFHEVFGDWPTLETEIVNEHDLSSNTVRVVATLRPPKGITYTEE